MPLPLTTPWLYGMYQSNRLLRTFAEMLDNLFAPLFEVSIDPTTHPKLHLLLQQVGDGACHPLATARAPPSQTTRTRDDVAGGGLRLC